jgi:flagellar FliJ protein
MTKWAQSLIRISTHEVETLQKRLAEIVDRRCAAELRLTVLQAEAEGENYGASRDAEAGWYHIGFLQGVRWRRDAIEAEIALIAQEEIGARDALAHAFEELKKFEQVAESARVAAVKEAARKETAAMDELGARKVARG